MFKQIAPAVALGNITLAISATKDGQMQVAFIQKPSEDNKVPIPPRYWAGTPEELDACVAAELAELVNHRTTSVAAGLAEAKKAMDDAVEAEKEAAKNRATKSAKPGVTKVVPGAAPAKAKPTLSVSDDENDESGTDTGSGGGADTDDDTPPVVSPEVAASSSNAAAAQGGGLFD